jgi:HD-GYP domain-containing protein (c-di-GMP phosphodiesterase class II)
MRAVQADTGSVRLHLLPDFRQESVRVSDVLAALSFALDLSDGQPAGHALRTTLIGMELADRLGLGVHDRRDLYYSLMLKDVGCSSTSGRVFELFGGDARIGQHRLLQIDWGNYFKAVRFQLAYSSPELSWFERVARVVSLKGRGTRLATELVETRSRRGAEIVRELGFNVSVAEAVGCVDEHWDGSGHPKGMRESGIPLHARVIAVAQVLEVFATVHGPRPAVERVRHLKGRKFDPTIAEAARGIEPLLARWSALDADTLRFEARECEPGEASLLAGPGTLDCIARGFADVVDAKSPYTAQHSSRVSDMALRIGACLGFSEQQLAELRRAALLHDIGKLSVSNAILDKPGPLTAEEWEAVRLHPYYTQRILEHIRGFERLAMVAASHHERLDGRGYFHGLRGDQIPLASQVLATADVHDALTAERPYRPALPEEVALRLMEQDRGNGLRDDCLDALYEVLVTGAAAEVRKAA